MLPECIMARIGNINHQQSRGRGEAVYYHRVPISRVVIAATKLNKLPMVIE
jgi:hypothetical protein